MMSAYFFETGSFNTDDSDSAGDEFEHECASIIDCSPDIIDSVLHGAEIGAIDNLWDIVGACWLPVLG